MMDPLEQKLKDALRREEPPLGFAARVAARAREQEQRSWWSGFAGWRLGWVVALVICVAMLGGVLLQRERAREQAEGEAARQQVRLALRIAGSKVRLAQTMVQQINEGNAREQ